MESHLTPQTKTVWYFSNQETEQLCELVKLVVFVAKNETLHHQQGFATNGLN